MPSPNRILLSGAALLLGFAAGASAESTASLDADMQATKRLALEMHRDLLVLRDRTLFPEDVQVDVFISVQIGMFFDLKSVKLVIDQVEVAHQDYGARQSEALKLGGTQKLYVGKLSPGQHEVVAIVAGVGRHYPIRRAIKLDLDKKTGTQLIDFKLTDGESRQDLALVATVTP